MGSRANLRRAGYRANMSEPSQPQIEPLAVDGLAAVIVCQVGWLVAEIVLLLVHLPPERLWWRWVPVAGFGMGLLGLTYVLRRRAAYRAAGRAS